MLVLDVIMFFSSATAVEKQYNIVMKRYSVGSALYLVMPFYAQSPFGLSLVFQISGEF